MDNATPTRQLSNSELGRVLGMTASGASRLRNGLILPSALTLQTMVEKLPGAEFDELNKAMVAARFEGNTAAWTTLVERLTTVPVEESPHAQRY
jgi:hypothetical protein